MNNKARIEEKLKQLILENIDNEGFIGVETISIADELELRRNVVSALLNELVEEGLVEKTKTRPVYFWHTDIKRVLKEEYIDEVKESVFSDLIGAKGSLKNAVEQCKSAVFYPNKGMSILLTGPSGVGKSYIASLLHKYAIQKGRVNEDAPFVVFNCADYADNPELLSASLFGYTKGSFTGADGDHVGSLESADGGYLFLDEVHRLSPEGQEKLFVFMDQGVFKRLGESKAERKANVRFIFATTENTQESLLETFTRRIPLVVDIPRLSDRPIDERLTLIYRFFRSESIELNKDIKINNKVINYILSLKNDGNVGKLKNIIKFCCAYAYKDQIDNDFIEINRKHLTSSVGQGIITAKSYYFHEYMMVYKDVEENQDIHIVNDNKLRRMNEIVIEIDKLLTKYDSNIISLDELRKELTIELNRSLELIVYDDENLNDNNDIIENMYLKTITNTLKLIEENYGIKYYGNTSKLITKCIMFFKNNPMENTIDDRVLNITNIKTIMGKKLSKVQIIGDRLIRSLESNLDLSLDERVKLLITLYIFTLMNNKSSSINGIIVAHGYSTASSIASVANRLYGQFIFEAFDMPIDMSPIEVTKLIKNYVESIDTTKGTIILVDMGSLVYIHNELEDVIDGDLGVINNITTNIAVDIAGRIINGQEVETMIEGIRGSAVIDCKFFKGVKKKKAILTTCISGIGTAVKLKKLIKGCIGNTDIEVIEYEFNKLSLMGKDDKLFKDYDVKLIISTTELKIEGVKCLLLEELMKGEGDEDLVNILKESSSEKNIDIIRQDLVKMFSMQNLLTQLTILNPNKIINEVESIIMNYERRIGTSFSLELKLTLYIHTSILIERLMLKQGLEFTEEQEKEYKLNNVRFIDCTLDVFGPILNEYNLDITMREINILETIIESRVGKLEKFFTIN